MIFDKFFSLIKRQRRQMTTLNLVTTQFDEGPLTMKVQIEYKRFGAQRSSESIDLGYGDVVLLHKALGDWLEEHEEDYEPGDGCDTAGVRAEDHEARGQGS